MYHVFGYTCDCEDFSFEFDNFVEAVKAVRNLEKALCVVFADGFSRGVKRKLFLF